MKHPPSPRSRCNTRVLPEIYPLYSLVACANSWPLPTPFTTLLLCTVRFETQLSFFFLIFILHIKFWGIREYPHSPSCHQTWCAVCQRNYLWIECKMCGFTSGFQKGTLTTWTDNLSVTDVTGVCIYNVQCVYVTGHAVNSFFSADSICKRYYQIIELIFCLFIFNS